MKEKWPDIIADVWFKPWLDPLAVNFQSVLRSKGYQGTLLNNHPEMIKAVEEWNRDLERRRKERENGEGET